MNGFERRRERKKQYILNALTDLVMTRNFKEIGVREIAKCAGVSPASIYKFFGSKEELAKQVLYKHLEKVKQNADIKLSKDASFKDKCNILCEIYNDTQKVLNSDGIRNLMIDDPTFKKHFEEHARETINSVIYKIIEQSKQKGEIPNIISTEAITIYVSSAINAISSIEINQDMNLKLRNELMMLFFYGIFGENLRQYNKNTQLSQ